MVRKVVHNAFLDTLTMIMPFPRVPLEMIPDACVFCVCFVSVCMCVCVCVCVFIWSYKLINLLVFCL